MTLPLFPEPPRVVRFTVLVDSLPHKTVMLTINKLPDRAWAAPIRPPHSASCAEMGNAVGSTSAARMVARIGEHAVWQLAIRTGGRSWPVPLQPPDARWRRIVEITGAILEGREVTE